jgi:Spy/CpxP family protein refolding chaperone
MKKTIIAAITLLTLTAGASFAQRNYPSPYNRPAPANSPRDEYREELKIDRIDAIVGLSRRQEKQLHKIEDNYDRMMATSRMTPDGARQLQLRKRQDMLAVLTSAQRDRLFAQQQQYRRPNAPFGGRRG